MFFQSQFIQNGQAKILWICFYLNLQVMAEQNQEQGVGQKVILITPKENDEGDVGAPEGYQFVRTLGDGSFGKVKLGIHLLSGQKVAIKILCKQRIRERTDIERISRQIKIMKVIRHPFVVQMYEIIESPKHLFLVMEYVESGDLFDQISAASKLHELDCKRIFSQLVIGLQYLHNCGITHRDMKPENILIGDNGAIKIADFGLGNFFTGQQKLKTACGSPCYAPPQMLNQEEYDPRKVDIWSSGVILYAMVHGYLPFQDDVTSLLYQKIKTKNLRVASWVGIPCRNLLRGVLTKNQEERWDIQTIKKHQFLHQEIAYQQKQVYQEIEATNPNEFHLICQNLGIVQEQRLLNSLKKNKHNNLTTLYYLSRKKYLREKIANNQVQKQVQSKKIQQDINDNQGRNLFSFSQKDEDRPKINQQENLQQISAKTVQHFQQKQQVKIIISNQKPTKNEQLNNQTQSQHTDMLQSIQIRQAPLKTIEVSQFDSRDSKLEIVSPKIEIKQEKPEIAKSKQTKTVKQPTKSLKVPSKKTPQQDHKNILKQQQDIKNSQLDKKILKKSQRMQIHKPQPQISRVHEGQIKLYQRSHSKDKPIILKNRLKTENSSIYKPNSETIYVTSKQIYVEPHILAFQRIAICSADKLSEALTKMGYLGKFEYYLYDKQSIYVSKSDLKRSKNYKGPLFTLDKIIQEVNQNT